MVAVSRSFLIVLGLTSLLYGCGSGGSSGTTDNDQGQGMNDPPSNPGITDNLGIGDVESNPGFALANNSALLSGPTFGLNTDSNVSLRKGVAFEAIGEVDDIVTEQVIIVREEFNAAAPFVVAYIRNNSNSIRRGILFDDIEIVHEDGEIFEVVDHFFSSGGVNDSDDTPPRVRGNCLPPQGTGYHVIAGSGQGLFDKVETVRFSVNDGFNISGGIQALPGTVLPVSYEILETASDGVITLLVSVQNNLSRSISIAPPNVFALDDNGQTVMYSAAGLDFTEEAFAFAPGETKGVTIVMRLTGQSSTIRASVSFRYL